MNSFIMEEAEQLPNISWSPNRGGPLYYFGNRNLSLPDFSGHMRVDPSWLQDSFKIIFSNCDGKKFNRCYEPFAGSACWSLTAMELGFSKEYWINDSNKALIGVFKLIKSKPDTAKNAYAFLVKRFNAAKDKELFFKQTIEEYNSSNMDRRSEILPFIINYSWGGMVFYDDQASIVYRQLNMGGKRVSGYLTEASIKVEQFNEEVDRVHYLLRHNEVHFQSLDFQEALKPVEQSDFVILNPPYPENDRSYEQKHSLYYELYPLKSLHRKICKMIGMLESKGVAYLMSYGLYNPDLKDFVVNEADKRYLRQIGDNRSIFGKAIDQMYVNRGYDVPDSLKGTIVPASELLAGHELSHAEALEKFNHLALANSMS